MLRLRLRVQEPHSCSACMLTTLCHNIRHNDLHFYRSESKNKIDEERKYYEERTQQQFLCVHRKVGRERLAWREKGLLQHNKAIKKEKKSKIWRAKPIVTASLFNIFIYLLFILCFYFANRIWQWIHHASMSVSACTFSTTTTTTIERVRSQRNSNCWCLCGFDWWRRQTRNIIHYNVIRSRHGAHIPHTQQWVPCATLPHSDPVVRFHHSGAFAIWNVMAMVFLGPSPYAELACATPHRATIATTTTSTTAAARRWPYFLHHAFPYSQYYTILYNVWCIIIYFR